MDELRFIPINTEDSDPGVFVQGIHVPARLVEESGVWIREAGSAILTRTSTRSRLFIIRCGWSLTRAT